MSKTTIQNRRNQDANAFGNRPLNRFTQEQINDILYSPDGMKIMALYHEYIDAQEYEKADRLLRETVKDKVFVSIIDGKGINRPGNMGTIQWFIKGADHLDFNTEHTIGLSHRDLIEVRDRINLILSNYDVNVERGYSDIKPAIKKKYRIK